MCWILIEFFDKSKIQEVEYIKRWKSTPAGDMCEAVKDFPVPGGENLTLGDLMAETSRNLLSKVMNEEKFFQTWHSGRTVLLGDGKEEKGKSDMFFLFILKKTKLTTFFSDTFAVSSCPQGKKKKDRNVFPPRTLPCNEATL